MAGVQSTEVQDGSRLWWRHQTGTGVYRFWRVQGAQLFSPSSEQVKLGRVWVCHMTFAFLQNF